MLASVSLVDPFVANDSHFPQIMTRCQASILERFCLIFFILLEDYDFKMFLHCSRIIEKTIQFVACIVSLV